MVISRTGLSRRALLGGFGAGVGAITLTACGSDDSSSSSSGGSTAAAATLTITAIPDQDPELLARLYGSVAERFSDAIGGKVEYVSLSEYPAVVRAFEVGDTYLSWMGGLTGVQARQRIDGAVAFAQRDIDPDFTSTFIATTDSGIDPFTDVSGLTAVSGKTLTFGSETSTSGRLMPQYYLGEAGVETEDLAGEPGYSGAHDATIEAVASGSFEVGALNTAVWEATVELGEVDLTNTVEIFKTPGYFDYHWLARPDLDEKFGEGTLDSVKEMLFSLDAANAEDKEILDLFTAGSFIPTENANYDLIEQVAEQEGLLA